jgi:hypothetical protein
MLTIFDGGKRGQVCKKSDVAQKRPVTTIKSIIDADKTFERRRVIFAPPRLLLAENSHAFCGTHRVPWLRS